MKRLARYRRRWPVIALALYLAVNTTPTQGRDPLVALPDGPVRMVIREKHAVINEPLTADFSSTNTVVAWAGYTPSADVSSLVLRDRHRELVLLGWRHGREAAPPLFDVATPGRRVHLSPPQPAPPSPFLMSITAAIPGNKRFSLVYAITGLTWQTSYDVLVRGNLNDLAAPLSVDVDGWISVSNQTGRSFASAIIGGVVADSRGQPPDLKPPGILSLSEESDLAGFWRHQPADPPAPHAYDAWGPVDMPDNRTIMHRHVAVVRKPVDRELLIQAADIPTDPRQRGGQPAQWIQFSNTPDFGGGGSLPPGPALIHLGSQRSTIYQKAWFEHTPARGMIRINMGAVPGMDVRRLNRGRIERVDGSYEQVYELRVASTINHPATLVIEEHPPVTLAWTLLRANHSYDVQGRALVFRLAVPAGGEASIQYAVRVLLPGGTPDR